MWNRRFQFCWHRAALFMPFFFWDRKRAFFVSPSFIKCHFQTLSSPFFSTSGRDPNYTHIDTYTPGRPSIQGRKMRERRVPLELNFFKVLVSNQTTQISVYVCEREKCVCWASLCKKKWIRKKENLSESDVESFSDSNELWLVTAHALIWALK